jgi:hypothetical protein
MSLQDFLPENPNYPQQFKFPDTVNNNVKIKYHYLDATFTATTTGGVDQSVFSALMNQPNSNLLKSYKNVKSIELISAFFHSGDVTSSVMYMHIDELEGVIDSTVVGGQRSFAKLLFDTTTAINTNYRSAQIDYGMNSLLEFETKGKRLDKLTISFKNSTGTVLTFDNTNLVSLTFKIGVVEPIVPA